MHTGCSALIYYYTKILIVIFSETINVNNLGTATATTGTPVTEDQKAVLLVQNVSIEVS